MRERGLNVEGHADHFRDDAPDPGWLIECGQKNWMVLANDKQIRHNELERTALLKAQVASFILTSGNMAGQDMADAFIKALPRIAQFLKNKKRPFIARINKNGEVELSIDAKGKNHLKIKSKPSSNI